MRIRVQNRKIQWRNLGEQEAFYKKAEGNWVELKILDQPSKNLRSYFEGCLVPVFFYMHPGSGWKTFADARNALKQEFLPKKYSIDRTGLPFEVTPSLADMNKEATNNFTNAIFEWMIEQGVDPDVINSEAYKEWRDTHPWEKFYPPFQKLVEKYKIETGELS